jgi:putative flippase GtrA
VTLLSPSLHPALHRFWARLLSAEVLSFLTVGGLGYVTDVAVFNVLLSTGTGPVAARVLAVGVAMVVTYYGNLLLTWRGSDRGRRHREMALFVLFNAVGLGISVGCLLVSHDLLGLTSRLADNVSANVVGLALGTLFRFWSYRRFVFAGSGATSEVRREAGAYAVGPGGLRPALAVDADVPDPALDQ